MRISLVSNSKHVFVCMCAHMFVQFVSSNLYALEIENLILDSVYNFDFAVGFGNRYKCECEVVRIWLMCSLITIQK